MKAIFINQQRSGMAGAGASFKRDGKTVDIIKVNADRYDIVSKDGKTLAYIEKNYFGTHGNWRGWEHFVYCKKLDRFILPSAFLFCCEEEYMEDVPDMFRDIKQVKKYYGG